MKHKIQRRASWLSSLGLRESLVLASVVSLLLLCVTFWLNRDWHYNWMAWNLFLAWVPLVLSTWLVHILQVRIWTNWLPLLVSLAWLLFLPNTFYMVTDFIHLSPENRAEHVFDAIMLMSFAVNGLLIGFVSLYQVHRELARRLGEQVGVVFAPAVLIICSYAIYVGRFLRWNSWDVVVNAPSVLFEVTDVLFSAGTRQSLITTTFGFFALLASLYFVAWQVGRRIE